MRIATPILGALALAGCGQDADPVPTEPAAPTHIEVDDLVLKLPGGAWAHAPFHSAAKGPPVASLLLLHQARGDARGEYGPVVGWNAQ